MRGVNDRGRACSRQQRQSFPWRVGTSLGTTAWGSAGIVAGRGLRRGASETGRVQSQADECGRAHALGSPGTQGSYLKQHNFSLDAWKGLAVVAVIGIHACNDAVAFPTDSANYQIGLFLRAVFNFAVALFFAVSGFLAPTNEDISRQGYLSYLLPKLERLWVPYVLWTLLNLALFKRWVLLDPVEFVRQLVLGTGIGIGYFVIVLSCLTALHPLFARMTRVAALGVATALTVASMLAMYWARFWSPDAFFIQYQYSALMFTVWIVFFYLGFAVRGGGGGTSSWGATPSLR